MKKALLIGLCILFSMGVHAQTTKGEINGTVTDSTNVTLPGVTVVIDSPALQGTRTTVTNANGLFRFPLLPLGVYQTTFSIPGFSTYTQKGVVVKVGEKTKVDVSLSPADLKESIVVTAEAPLIDTSTTDSSMEMDTEFLASIPTLTRSVEDLAKFVPGVTGVRMDPVNGGEGGEPNIRGGGQEGNQYMVDGTSVRSSMGFNVNVPQNFDSIESLQIVSDPYSPEYGKTMGGAINAVTKSGGNEFSGEAGFQWRNSSLENSRKPVQNDSSVTGFSRNKQWYNLGGPIIKDKLWFFVSYNYNKSTNESAGAAPRIIPAENLVNMDGTPYGSDYTVYEFPDGTDVATTEQYFFKLTYNINENMNLSVSGLEREYSRDTMIGMEDLYQQRTQDASRYKVNFNWIIGDYGVLEARYASQEDEFMFGGLTNEDIAWRYNSTIAWSYGNISRYDIQVQERDDWSIKYTGFWDTDSFGTHEYAIGYNNEEFSTDWIRGNTGDGEMVKPLGADNFNHGCNFTFNYRTDASGNIIIGADGRPIGVPVDYTESRDSLNPNSVEGNGLFLQDRITYGKWTVMLGVRMDEMEVIDDLGNTVWSWGYSDYMSPRLSLIYDLFGDQNHIFKFAYGEFRDATTTRIGEWFNQQGGNAYRQYLWVGATDREATEAELHDPANWQFSWEQSPESAPMSFDPDIEPNMQERWMTEYNWRMNPRHALTVRYTRAISSGLIEDIGVMDATTPSGFAFFLTNFEHKRRDYESIDLEFKGRFGEWMDYYFAYTWTDSRGTNPGNFENESLNNSGGSGNYVGVFGDHVYSDGSGLGDFLDWYTSGLGGRGYGDEGWYGKLSDSTDHAINFIGNFHLPYDMHITTAIQWNSGYFWTKKGYQNNYHGYFTFLEGRGSRKTSSLLWMDVTFTKNFTFFDKHQVELRLDIFNLLNSQKPVSYVEEDTVDFGTPYARQRPRAIQVGVLYRF